MRTLIAILTALMLFAATPVAAGDLEDAAAAYKARDYQKALRLWKSLAEQGNVQLQLLLGLKYKEGIGVPKDDAKVAYWLTKAAKQGDEYAQTELGVMYRYGHGVPEDYVLAYAWLSITAARGVLTPI